MELGSLGEGHRAPPVSGIQSNDALPESRAHGSQLALALGSRSASGGSWELARYLSKFLQEILFAHSPPPLQIFAVKLTLCLFIKTVNQRKMQKLGEMEVKLVEGGTVLELGQNASTPG